MLIYSYLIFLVVGILDLDVFFVIWMTRARLAASILPWSPNPILKRWLSLSCGGYRQLHSIVHTVADRDQLPNLVWLPHIRAPYYIEVLQHEFTISRQAVVYV